MTVDFWIAHLRHPQISRLGFPKMGLGIARRSVELEPFWKSHLVQTRAVVAEWIERTKKQNDDAIEIFVLGAGRLLDFDIYHALEHCSSITLVDADPTTVRSWRRIVKRNPSRVHAVTCELTATLTSWSRFLESIGKLPFDKFLEELERWPLPNSTREVSTRLLKYRIRRGVTNRLVLSLNLLSQIPVMWQDIVFHELRRRFGELTESQQQAAVLALIPSAGNLVEQHFELLSGLKCHSALLITDIASIYYESRAAKPLETDRPLAPQAPVERIQAWDTELDVNDWALRKGVEELVQPDLGIASLLAGRDPLELGPQYNLQADPHREPQHWLWHIKPAGFEDSLEGVVHHVAALAFRGIGARR